MSKAASKADPRLALEYRSTASLIPFARNARTHSPQQVDQIIASIKEFGWTAPILVDGENGILAGHGRVLAAKKLGMAEVPVIEVKHLTAEQRQAYVLADNKLALNSGWDDGLLALELGSLGADMLDLTGFTDLDLTALAEIGKLDFDAPPASVEENLAHIEDIRTQRKRGNDAVVFKSDTEKYLVIVFPSRKAREATVKALGLPEDERYLDACAVDIRLRFSAMAATPAVEKKARASPSHRAGANG